MAAAPLPDERRRVRHRPDHRDARSGRRFERRKANPGSDRQQPCRTSVRRRPSGGRGIDRLHRQDRGPTRRDLGRDAHPGEHHRQLGAPRLDHLDHAESVRRERARLDHPAEQGGAHVAAAHDHDVDGSRIDRPGTVGGACSLRAFRASASS